jgi:8-oxo-dGTP pyrophosphatase MutT (NUDIX family)
MQSMEQRLRRALSDRHKSPVESAGRTPSAVLVPLFAKSGEYYILFTKRTDKVRDHKGQISFPGGGRHEGDRVALDTALRECTEEIGLAPGDVHVLGELDDALTTTSNYIITPFVALIPYPYPFKMDGWEVEEIIEVPVAALLEEERRHYASQTGQETNTYFYHYQGRVIWGATGEILHQFLGIYSGAINQN